MKSIYSILCFLHNASEEDLISNVRKYDQLQML